MEINSKKPIKYRALKKRANATPMMQQYLLIKKEHNDCLLFYRMGDFYELFFEDAIKASGVLNIALTKRGKHLEVDIPMCGVPVHSHESYLNRLIKAGFRVAICEQIEDPKKAKKRGSNSIVKRDVVRIITPGTITEEALLSARKNNYLAAIGCSRKQNAIAWADISTGQFFTQPTDQTDLSAVINRIEPEELLVSDAYDPVSEIDEALLNTHIYKTVLPAVSFDSINGIQSLKNFFKTSTVDAFGDFTKAELSAAGALVDYVTLTQKGNMPRITKISRCARNTIMEIDSATRRNLELTSTLSGAYQGCLLSVIDKTVTGAGARLLTNRLSEPLTSSEQISSRLDAVSTFIQSDSLRLEIRGLLKQIPDIERALSRIAVNRGGPRDLGAIYRGLEASRLIVERLDADPLALLYPELLELRDKLGSHKEILLLLNSALSEELPLIARDGGFVKAGYSSELDGLLEVRDHSRQLILNLEQKYAKKTGVPKLRIKHNNVLGYFVEVTPRNADKMPNDINSPFIHRQSLNTAIRYTTLELSELENKISQAAERALEHEIKIFEFLVEHVLLKSDEISVCGQSLATLDVYAGLAILAVEKNYVRPKVNDSLELCIKSGRHPVVEVMLEKTNEHRFVSNDCNLLGGETNADNIAQIWLLSGPNMAGKSTFLRQCALISILAQMGSYVPAEYAKIGIIDRLFSRVGASDDLARGRSTFMVEMVETALILNQAGPRSLVILDEIGRGTSTFDGLSIAWAVVEHLHAENRCRALFATHYHELSALKKTLERLKCYTMNVTEWKGEVVFLHEVKPGSADRSYGIHVGSLAGLPSKVVKRAEQVLEILENDTEKQTMLDLVDDLPLFESLKLVEQDIDNENPCSEFIRSLETVNIDDITPKQAHDLLYELKVKMLI